MLAEVLHSLRIDSRHPLLPRTLQPAFVPPPPIHERELEINPQADCPFYNGRIPAEVRTVIFQFAVSEDAKTEVKDQYDVNMPYARPGYTAKKVVPISLLLTCRRIYMETYTLPILAREHVFWHARAPLGAYTEETLYFLRFAPWQLDYVRGIHLFTQMWWLERHFPHLCRNPVMQHVKNLKITIRRSDWWWNERNEPLAINPKRGKSETNFDVVAMRKDMAEEKMGKGGDVEWNQRAWGVAFKELRALKGLEIEFETSEEKEGELGAIVEWARGWRFPLKEGRVLSTEGEKPVWSKWRGKVYHWSQVCPFCIQGGEENDKCRERKEMIERQEGPMLVLACLKWVVVKKLEADRDSALLTKSLR